MFDSVYVPCPRCGASTEFQSKAGSCDLSIYTLETAPPEIVADLYEKGDVDRGERCPSCHHHFFVKRPEEPKKDEHSVWCALRRIDDSDVREGQQWLHTKTRSLYEIVGLSIDEARIVVLVTYRSIDDRKRRWTRDLDVFLGLNEDSQPRFVMVS
jgi:DNA-directed RNA polymerase subunit RPC12/RpoP